MRIDAVKLRTVLYQKGLTQGDLVKLSGVSRATVNAVATGKNCSRSTAERIANALDMKLEELHQAAAGK